VNDETARCCFGGLGILSYVTQHTTASGFSLSAYIGYESSSFRVRGRRSRWVARDSSAV